MVVNIMMMTACLAQVLVFSFPKAPIALSVSAQGGTRTLTSLRTTALKAALSTNSSTRAYVNAIVAENY